MWTGSPQQVIKTGHENLLNELHKCQWDMCSLLVMGGKEGWWWWSKRSDVTGTPTICLTHHSQPKWLAHCFHMSRQNTDWLVVIWIPGTRECHDCLVGNFNSVSMWLVMWPHVKCLCWVMGWDTSDASWSQYRYLKPSSIGWLMGLWRSIMLGYQDNNLICVIQKISFCELVQETTNTCEGQKRGQNPTFECAAEQQRT